MKSHVQAVVIGGGVVGASILYHLTKAGWRDVVLVERDELTSGSTWHAAGGMHTVNLDPNVAKLQQYTINLYKELEKASGLTCGIHITGGLMLAGTPERLDWLKLAHARGRYLGVESSLVTTAEAKQLFPFMEERHFIGALYHPNEGHVDPSGVTHAYAKAARLQGAEVYRFTRVVATEPLSDGRWKVTTDKGDIIADHLVNAGGLWARDVGRMAGLELPIQAMEHQYILTGEVPEIRTATHEMLHIIDFEAEIYMRQEGKGVLIGTYERAGVPWSENSTPWTFGRELLPPDIDRIASSLAMGFSHFPMFEAAGIRKIINGPFTFAPDGNPLVGPVRGLANYWVACGVMAGFSQGGGVGLALANWMIDGDPGFDIWGMDVSRFGDWASRTYTNAKVRETYSRRFRIRFPNEELPAGRPQRSTPVYNRLKQMGAAFGVSYGLEHAIWFAPGSRMPQEEATFRRSSIHEIIGDECRAVRNTVGLLEISTYAKYEITGPRAEAWLSRLLANSLPAIGRITLSPMLNARGKLIGDFTIARSGPEQFYIFGSGIAEDYHLRWFDRYLPCEGVALRSLRDTLTGLSIAGPNSRALLQRLTNLDVSNQALPFLSFRSMELAAIPVKLGRIHFSGDLGYEMWVEAGHQNLLLDRIVEAGEDLGLRYVGARALQSLRLEKSFGNWAREYRPIYGPAEAGLQRFVDFRKEDFIGRGEALREKSEGPLRQLVTFIIEETDVDCIGDEPIWHDGAVVGWITSGGYAHYSGKSIALGYVPTPIAAHATGFEVELLGERRRAVRIARAIFDPTGIRMRS